MLHLPQRNYIMISILWRLPAASISWNRQRNVCEWRINLIKTLIRWTVSSGYQKCMQQYEYERDVMLCGNYKLGKFMVDLFSIEIHCCH